MVQCFILFYFILLCVLLIFGFTCNNLVGTCRKRCHCQHLDCDFI